MTAAQVLAHPEFPHVIWKLDASREGKVAVAKGRGGPFNIAYKVHGRGPRLLLLILGLGSTAASWQRQAKDFGHTRGDDYSVLVFDNRGMGASDKPAMRYSTSEMARDTVEVLDHLGWTAQRSIHVVGHSMGGMIAQELGVLIPSRIATLTLLSTAAKVINTVGFLANLKMRAGMFIPKSLDVTIASAKRNLYADAWLTAPDAVEHTVEAFPTNGDRFAAVELTKRLDKVAFTSTGFIAQALAAGWHQKSQAQLSKLADELGRDRIMVIHGSEDRMVTVPHGQRLAEGLSGKGVEVQTVIWPGLGHVIPVEKREEFNELLADKIQRFHAV